MQVSLTSMNNYAIKLTNLVKKNNSNANAEHEQQTLHNVFSQGREKIREGLKKSKEEEKKLIFHGGGQGPIA